MTTTTVTKPATTTTPGGGRGPAVRPTSVPGELALVADRPSRVACARLGALILALGVAAALLVSAAAGFVALLLAHASS